MINGMRQGLVLGVGAALLMVGAAVQAQQIGAKAQNKGTGKNLPARDVLNQRERGIERTTQVQTPRTRSVETDIAAAADADGSGFYRATDVIGMTIRVEGETNVGVVKDIVLDSVTNEVAYFLVDSSTVLKTDGWLVVPYAAVQGPIFVEGRPVEYIRLSYGVDRLRRAPTLTRAGLRTLRGTDFFFTVNKFYGLERTRRGYRGDRDRDDRRRDRDRDRDGRDRDGDRPRGRDGDRNRDGDTDRPRRPGDRDNDPKARPRGDRDGDRPRTRPEETKRPDRDTPNTKPKARPETVKPKADRPKVERPKVERPKVKRPKVDVPKTDNKPKLPKKGDVDLPKEVKPKNIKKGVKGLLDPK